MMRILFLFLILFSISSESFALRMKLSAKNIQKEKKDKKKGKKKNRFNAFNKKSTDLGVSSSENTAIKGNTIRKEDVIARDSIINAGYQRQRRIADSIRNANKHWLDSTLSVLPKKKPVVINDYDEIEIFISGGGLYTGVNPTIFDRLTIYNSGLVYRHAKTKLQGETIIKNKISKDNLRKLAQFIINEGFYDFNSTYDCYPDDRACMDRLKSEPEPVPLSVVVAIGMRRKNVFTALYAPNMESNWVNYPANLEKIVNAIYDVLKK